MLLNVPTMKRSKCVLLLLVAAVLSGCATALPGIRDVDPRNLSDDQSLLLISMASEETCILWGASVAIKEVGKNPDIWSSIGIFQINNRYITSDFPNEYAKVYATLLKPGQYDLWLNANSAYLRYSDPVLTHPITLKPREIRYAGELRASNCGDMFLVVKDRRDRDIPLFMEIQPALDSKAINYELVQLRPGKGRR
jgi:hypothetical protein